MADVSPDLVIVGREELTPIPPRPTPRHPSRPRPEPRRRRAGILSRTREIVAANMTDLLDKAEDPAKMIRLTIAQMEETLIDVRASSVRTMADQQEMRRQIERVERLQASWTEKAELALSKNREDLATAALVEKQKAADMADHLGAEIAALDTARRASDIEVARIDARLREARVRQKAMVARLESARHSARLREMTNGARVDEAFARFDLLEQRIDLAEGRADALTLAPPALAQEFDGLRMTTRVEAELASMKAARARVQA